MHRIRILRNGAAVRDVALAGVVSVGRHPENVLCLQETLVSGHHARIVTEAEYCFLEDLGSTNGTYLDGWKLPPNEPRRLEGGERIAIGGFELQYLPELHVVPPESLEDDEILPPPRSRRPASRRAMRVLKVVALVMCVAALAAVVLRRLLA